MDRRVVTSPGLLPPPAHSPDSVVRAGTGLAFRAGSVPPDADGVLIGEGDPARQARRVLADPEPQPHAVEGDFAHVVVTEFHVVGADHAVLSALWDVVTASGLSAGPQSSRPVGVACRGHGGHLVETTATAVPAEGARP
ncbi:RidA family protein [Streptomyces actuosus]|uniref:RidA family protein n=1 Tax=Streptomyces actuosus TaxID=1885 RepID=A0ABS2VLM2_STRAS|nr:RidA family protein [Streptomyces actuosus]MBN0043990.1 RidA family protein [Streptomyces actuosus]